jgi:MFS family permease
LTRSLAPAPVPATRFNFSKLYRRSHTAFAGALGSGIIMGSFWSLGALYAVAETGDASFAAAFIAATIIGGVFSQYPIGLASDKIDRRFVLAALSILSALTAAVMVIATSQWAYLFAAFCFGAAGNSLYAVALAKAADNSRRDEFVTIGSSVLLLNAIGASLSSLLFGWAMREFGSDALFICIALCSLAIALFIGVQPRGKTAVSVEDQAHFVPATSAMAPAALSQDPRGDEDAEAA